MRKQISLNTLRFSTTDMAFIRRWVTYHHLLLSFNRFHLNYMSTFLGSFQNSLPTTSALGRIRMGCRNVAISYPLWYTSHPENVYKTNIHQLEWLYNRPSGQLSITSKLNGHPSDLLSANSTFPLQLFPFNLSP